MQRRRGPGVELDPTQEHVKSHQVSKVVFSTALARYTSAHSCVRLHHCEGSDWFEARLLVHNQF